MPDVKLLVSAQTDVGRARTTNEDAYAVNDLASGAMIEVAGVDHPVDVQERGVLLALSDGMGGHQAGEVASALVLESLQAALGEASDADAKGAIHEQLEEAVQRANQSVMNAARTDNRHGMGATLTAVFVRRDVAFIAEVGDSRAYLLRRGRLRQITRDQSLVQLLVDQGVLSAEQARRAPGKNVILQAVGLSHDMRVAIARLELRRGDRFFLCSDGVSNALSDDELREILTDSGPHAACETMIALANDRGGLDNQTAIVADLTGDGLDPPDEFETITTTYEVLKQYSPKLPTRPPEPELPDLPGLDDLPDAPSDPGADAPAGPPQSEVSGTLQGKPDAGATQQLPRERPGPSPLLYVAIAVLAIVAVLYLAGVLG